MRRWVQVGVAVVAGLAVLVVVAGVFFAATLAGGIDHLFRRPPDPHAADVTAARERTGPRADAEATDLGARTAQALGGVVVGRGARDACVVGAHSWKRDDPFDLVCTHERLVLVDVAPDGFHDRALALDEALGAGGWSAEVVSVAVGGEEIRGEPRGLPWVVSEYWLARAAPEPVAADVARLPASRYRSDGDEVTVAWTDGAEADVARAAGHRVGDVVVRDDPVGDEWPFGVRPGRAVAVVGVRVTYWDR